MKKSEPSETQQQPELPEASLDLPDVRFQSVISPAKRCDAHLRPHIGREDARPDLLFQKKAVRSE
jgi:hypothetical protein